MRNIILASDSYKQSHFMQFPPNTKFLSSYIEARVGKGETTPFDKICFAGMQGFVKEYLSKPITIHDVNEAEGTVVPHGLPFNKDGWMHILNKYGGYMPLEIAALPEGSFVPRGTPLVQLTNLDPELPWLVGHFETPLLRAIWYPTGVATLSGNIKAMIYDALLKTSDDPLAGLPFKLHDFGARGVSSGESAAIGGAAHLMHFKGTDTLEALPYIRKVYGDTECMAYSVPASEHSTMTAWGRNGESDAYANMIDKFGDGIVSIVSDSYDLWNALENIYGDELKNKIINVKGKVVIRPDSGDPVSTPIQTIMTLGEKFGYTVNSKGFKVLNAKLGVLQGDGLSFSAISRLLHDLTRVGWSTDNIVFGMGGGLLQHHMRDDYRFAMKANAIDLGDGWQDLQKNPATDPTKASKAGRQIVIDTGKGYVVKREKDASPAEERNNALKQVYSCGSYPTQSFASIREHAEREVFALREEYDAFRTLNNAQTAKQDA